jgi:RpiB/LacA/LacB family sugar-phosphate isomerase
VRIAVGSDHAGFELKEAVRRGLEAEGHQVADLGAYTTESSDFPDVAFKVAEAVARGEVERGVLMCNTGIGMSIAANKVPGARAAQALDEESARLTRNDNDSNILTFGRTTTTPERALGILRVWLATPFSGESRHERRVGKIEDYERRTART